MIGLEARDRIGGRVYTDENGNELGAAWIHGTEIQYVGRKAEINPVYKLAQECIPPEDLFKTMNFFAVHSDGSDLGCESTIWHSMWNVLNKVKHSEAAKLNGYRATDQSVYDYMEKNWTELLEDLRGESELAIVKSVIEWQSYYATNWETTSIGSMAVDVEFDGDQLLIKNGGYTRILNHYLDAYKLREKIRLNSPVSKIEILAEGGCRVTTKEGVVFEADTVVVTVPLGVLKNNGIIFEPALPEYKQQSIDRLGFGVYDKVFVTFDGPVELEQGGFWPDDANTVSVVPKANDDFIEYARKATTGKNVVDPGNARRPYNERDSDHIGIEMSNITAVSDGPKIVMLIYDQGAKEMEKIAHDNEALNNFVRVKLANAFPGAHIPNITSVQATTWGSDQYAYGSFANIPLGASGRDMANLAEPVGTVLFWAGEATYPLHFSTVHGAFFSALREYARLMKIYYPSAHNEFEPLLLDPEIEYYNRPDIIHKDD